MKLTQIIAASMAIIGSAIGAPARKSAITDADILNYALTLEHLENTFYREGLAKFGPQDFINAGYSAAFYNNLAEVSYDESTHVTFLTGALKAAGYPAVKPCTYNFGIDSVSKFLATASVLEGVGVTAYIGAAGYIANKNYLTAAGTILTVEARHSAYLRSAGLAQSPFPQAFDVPLDFNEVYTLAAPFIVSCPKDNPTFLPLKAFPALTVATTGTIKTGSQISVSYSTTGKRDVKVSVNAGGKKPEAGKKEYAPSHDGVSAAFITVTGPVWATVAPSSSGLTITVPAGVHGQSYLVITKNQESAADENIIAGPAIVEISGTDGFP